MSKRNARGRGRREVAARPRDTRRRQAALLAVVLSLAGAGAGVARWRSLRAADPPRAAATAAAVTTAVTQSPSFAPDRPSKEYIYAGSRLLATEEPAAKSDQTITFEAVADRTFGDAPFALSATATSNLPVSFTVTSGPAAVSGNTLTIGGAGAVTVRAEQAGSDAFNPAPSVTRSFDVTKANQTITFDAAQLSGKTYGDAPFVVTASSSAGLPVTFTATGGVSVSGNTVTINAAGAASARASAAGDANYNEAADVEHSFTAAKAAAAVTLSNLSHTYDGAGKGATATTSPAGLPVTLAYTRDGAPVASPTDAGGYAVTATVNDQNYAGSAAGTLTINKAAATLALGQLNQTYDGTPRAVAMTTSPANLSGVTVTYNGSQAAPANAGSYAVVASLSHANYTAANATGTLVVAKATPTVAWPNPADISYGTYLGAAQLNATPTHLGNTVAGTLAYTPGAGSVLPAGNNQLLSVAFTPADSNNFNPAAGSARVNVLPAAPRSLSLNGTTSRVEVPNSSSINLTTTFTAEAWVRLDSSAPHQSIFERFGAPDGSGNNGGFILRVENGRLKFFVLQSSQAGIIANGNTVLTTGVWHHVAAVCDGSQLRVYLDGRLDGTLTPGFGYLPATGTAPLYVGSGNWGGGYLGGLIDEARLTASVLYTSDFVPETSLGAVANTRGLWKLDGQTWNDFSGNSNTGAPVGGAAFSTEPAAFSNVAQGKTATQSSTGYGGSPERAVDGNTSGDWSAASVTHTSLDPQAWWQSDLGGSRAISAIKVWNRTDCCADRLSNFYVFVSDAPFASTDLNQTLQQAGVSGYHTAGQGGTPTTVNVNRTGRYVRVQLAGSNYLSLAEVEMWAAGN